MHVCYKGTMVKIKQIQVIIGLCFGLVAGVIAQDTVPLYTGPVYYMQTTLQDSEFDGIDSIWAELLETGERRVVTPGAPFVLRLPVDTIWSLCVYGGAVEKCYEVNYTGTDTAFSHVLTGDSLQVQYAQVDTVEQQPELLPTTPTASADSSKYEELLKTATKKTRLNKIVLQFRKRPKRELGKSIISTKRMKRLPALAEADVIRSLQALPGVVASSDFSTKIYVRGGGSDQNLFLLDNAEVYSPVHFFGLFSTFLVEAIDDVQFYKGGFAPQYGNRLSSVVDISSRKGGTDTTEAYFDKSSVKISTFATQAHTEGRQGQFRWLVAGRTTYIKTILDALKKANLTDFSIDYYFFDLQGSLRYDINEEEWMMLSYYGGKDDLLFDPLYVDWGNQIVPFNWRFRLNENWMSHLTLSYSFFSQNFGISDFLNMENSIQTGTYQHKFMYEGFTNHQPEVGVDIKRMKTDFTMGIVGLDNENGSNIKKLWHLSSFAQDKWQLGSWNFNYGLRFTYQTLLEHFGVEPRATINYALNSTSGITFHAGYYLQYINSIIFGDTESLNEFYFPASKGTVRDLMPSNSILLSAGYNKERILDQFNFTFEVYYKTLNNLLIFAPEDMLERYPGQIDNGNFADLTKSGEGYSFGYELMVRKDEGVITGGLSWSQGYSGFLEQWDEQAYFPDWYQPRSLKGDIGVTWRGSDGLKPHKKTGRYFRSSAQVSWNAGLPYTEFIGYNRAQDIDQGRGTEQGGPAVEYAGGTVERIGPRNGSFLPDYFRLDIKPIDIGRDNVWNFSWTILNLTNNENVFTQFYDTTTNPPTSNTITQFPFFPLLLNYERYF
jgi:hypothetical protein